MKLNMNRSFLSVLVILFFSTKLLAQDVTERVKMNTDKHVYLSGETMFFKIITTDRQNCPQDLSKVAYVELIGKNNAVFKLMVELRNSVGVGSFKIPEDLASGGYEVIGYTAYMRNEGAKIYARIPLVIVNTTVKVQPANFKLWSGVQESVFTDSDKSINLKLDAQQYRTRQLGRLLLDGLPKDLFTLSVSIAGEDIVHSNKIEQNDSTSPRNFAQNYFYPEYEGAIVHGRLIDQSTGKLAPVKNINAMIAYPGSSINIFSGISDEQGNVDFVTKRVAGHNELVSIVDQGSKYRVDIASPFDENIDESANYALTIDSLELQKLRYRNFAFKVFEDIANDSTQFDSLTEPLFSVLPSKIYNLDEYTRFSTMKEMFVEFVKDVRFSEVNGSHKLEVLSEEMQNYSLSNALVLLDGIPVFDHEKIYQYNPANLKSIDVYFGKMDFGTRLYDGMVSFHTYKSNYHGFQFDSTMTLIDYPSSQLVNRRMRVPLWTSVSSVSRTPDFRHTLLWEPNIDLTKEDISLPFYTSDYCGRFKVEVDGLTRKGEVVRKTVYFNVEE